eukprot:7594607-Pyramimonas_sp.AAC.1
MPHARLCVLRTSGVVRAGGPLHGACLHSGAGAVGACPRWRASRACWLSQRDVLLSEQEWGSCGGTKPG